MNKLLPFILLLPLLFSCVSKRNTAGTYRSNVASLGFFITRIKFNADSTIEYSHSGDLIYDTAGGKYHTQHRKIYVKFEALKLDEYYSASNVPILKTKRDSRIAFSYDYVYAMGRKKIFSTHIETGKKVTRTWAYSKRKKHILFGSHFYKRRAYLKKIK